MATTSSDVMPLPKLPGPESPVEESVVGLGVGETVPDSPPALPPPPPFPYESSLQKLDPEDTNSTRKPVEYTPINAQARPIPPDDAVPPPVYVTSDRSPGDIRVERLGDELSPDSSVWPAYVATAATSDAEMVDSWNKGLDVLLIFSSLFSAVVTTFVIESSRDLKPDYQQINALLTAHLLKGLNNPGNSSYLANLPSPEKLLTFEKPALAKVVNILWFAALGFSLSGVLIAMLAKQWLVAYGSQPQDEPQKTACQRQRKYDCLQQWSLPWILTLLPALLHASLFLFLIGLILYLWQLDSTVSMITCIILGILFLFYFASGALAAFSTGCPYITPLSDFIHSIFRFRDGSSFQADIAFKDLSTKAVMWLATTTNEPQTVSIALQSLAGLRRGFTGYEADRVQHLAKLALERLRGCFIPEWRNGDTYSLRTERRYEASCYSRTLMHLVDDTRVDPNTFSAILDEPSLPVFIQLLASCSDHSISLLALCDHQRLLHQIELRRWLSVSSRDGGHDLSAAAKMVSSGPSQKNMEKIVKCLSDYLKGFIFFHPYAIEIAVETIGFAPLSWTTAVFTKDPPLSNIVDPLVKLLGATRESVIGVRRAIARTFSILARIHGISRMDDPVDDFALRFDSAILIVKDVEGGDPSDSGVREMLLAALSQFVVKFQEDGISTVEICEELFYECDRRCGDELPTYSDKAAVTTLLPLLLVSSLKPEQKARIIRSLHGNAVSAAQSHTLPDDSFLHNITPPNPFPPETVTYLLKTLEGFKNTSYSWLRDVSVTLYLITRSPMSRHLFLEEAPLVISLIQSFELHEISSHLFWILSDAVNETIMAGTEPELTQRLISAGMLDVFREYCTEIGLTPSDVHLWSSILSLLSKEPYFGVATVEYWSELTEHMHTQFEAQEADHSAKLFELREPLLQFSFQLSSTYTSESATETLRVLGAAFGSSQMAPQPPKKTYSPTGVYEFQHSDTLQIGLGMHQATIHQSKGSVSGQHHHISGEGSEDKDVNAGWPSEAHYMPILPNARRISVTAQPRPMKKTLRAAIRVVSGDAIFDSAYPAGDDVAYRMYHHDVLHDCATKLGYKKLATRFSIDSELLKLSAYVLNSRVSYIRTDCKDVASAKIEGFYLSQAHGAIATAELIKVLIEKADYIYPSSEVFLGGAIDTKQPFYHPAIISTLKEYFFSGSHGSKADKHDNRFKSSLSEGNANSERELPITMVSLVAAMIHASLDNWTDGSYQKKSDFRAEAYEDVYNGHSMFLNELKVEKPIFFHKLMSGLYNEVAAKKNNFADTISRNNMARLNLDDIEG